MKIRKIKFNNHEILGNLELNFCDKDGNAVDTIFIAGENGTGKSTILEEIYKICGYQNIVYNFQDNSIKFNGNFRNNTNIIELEKNKELLTWQSNYDEKNNFIVYEKYENENNWNIKTQSDYDVIFSNIFGFGINFSNSAMDLDLDSIVSKNIKSDNNLYFNINQLLFELLSEDNENFRRNIIEKNMEVDEAKKYLKISRFISAFSKIFDDLEFCEIRTRKPNTIPSIQYNQSFINNRIKDIIFKRNNKEISIDDLSSGEKQIVYRGSFLLKDKNALNGAIVLIDEPEISLHPDWQKKIMDFYKGIFTNEEGIQTSQIIVVTHSPFILHNYNRTNDKVIVLKRENNEIKVMDKPEFYSIGEKEAIKEAFNIKLLINEDKNIIFVEGKTDVDYFNKAIEIFDIKNFPAEFKLFGDKSEGGGKGNGASNLKNAYESLTTNQSIQKSNIKPIHKVMFLLDCDEKKDNKKDEEQNNCYLKFLTKNYQNTKIPGGIENLLNLENIDIERFYDKKEEIKNDGGKLTKEILNKTKLCDEICNKTDKEELRKIFKNFKDVLDELQNIFKN